ncbi:MAG: tetratricopeptide repeat protein [Chthoniobacterales bacterium]
MRLKKLLPLIAIVVAVCAAYAPVVRDGFVWDDTALILRDPLIRSWRLIPEGFQHFLFTDATPSDFYRPIQRLTYTFEYWAFAARPAAYHVTSVLCHVLAALAFLLFANEFLGRFAIEERRRRVAVFFATLAWAVHPLHHGAVAYVSGRADPLSAAFGFAALYFALRSDRTAGAAVWRFSIAAAALFLCSALSKEMGLIFPALWCAIIITGKQWRDLVRWGGVTAAMLVIYASLRLAAEHIPAPRIQTPPPPLVRPIIAARALAEYAGLLVLPINLHVERDVETKPDPKNPDSAKIAAWRELETLAGMIVMGGWLFWIWRSRKRDAAVFTILVCGLLAYLPISGALLLNAGIAEHWIYLPSAFVLLAAAVELSRRAGFVIAAFAGAWLVSLATTTFRHTFDWKDQQTFFSRTIAAGGDSARMLINLAIVEISDGKLEDAKKHLGQALEKAPKNPLAVINLAAVAVRQKDFKRAHELVDQAATMDVVAAQAQELRVILDNQESGKVDLMRMRLASRTGVASWPIEKRYVRLLAENGALAAAIAETKGVLKTDWYRAETWELLGELCVRAGMQKDAAEAFERAHAYDVHLQLRPKVL